MKNFKNLTLLVALVASASITKPMFQGFKASALKTAEKLGVAVFKFDIAARAKMLKASNTYYEMKALPSQLVAAAMKPYAMYSQIVSLRANADKCEKAIELSFESAPYSDHETRLFLWRRAADLHLEADELEKQLS